MRKLMFIFLLFGLFGFLLPKKLADLPELTKYPSIFVLENQLYVQDFPYIHMYSLNPVKHIMKFGKEGAGPGEP